MKRQRTPIELSRICTIAGIVLLIVGLGVAWKGDESRTPPPGDSKRATGEPAPADTAAPSTQKPRQSDFDKYQVAPDAPRYILIPEIDVKAMIKQVGVTPDNHIEAPHNIFDVGWFNQSARPGDAGASLMAGHVSSWNSPGIFYKLKTLRPGDSIVVQRGDDSKLTYTVVKSVVYAADKVDMEAALKPVNPTKPGLNLITCAGKVIKGTNDFDQRMIVFAEQL